MSANYNNGTVISSTVIPHTYTSKELPISLFPKATVKNGTPPDRILSLDEFLQYLQTDPELARRSRESEERLAQTGKTNAFKRWRAQHLPVFMAGHYRARGELSRYGQLLVFDIDGLDEVLVAFTLEDCDKVPIILAAFPSPSRQGLRILVLADSDPDTHKAHYHAIAGELATGLKIPRKSKLQQVDGPHIDDETTDALHHIWFCSHVPTDQIYLNWESEIYRLEDPEEIADQVRQRQAQQRPKKGSYKYEFTMADKVENMIDQVEARRLDLTPGKTGNWFRIGCALVDGFGENGREYFHRVSQFHPGYDREACDRQFDECKSKHNGRIRIDTFFKLYGDAGVKVDFERLVADRREENLATVPEPKPEKEETLPELPDPDPEKTNLQVDREKHCYLWRTKTRKGEDAIERISNFTILPLYLLLDSHEPKRIWKLTNYLTESTTICFPVRHLASQTEFAALVEGKGNFVTAWTGKQLSAIKEYLYEHEQRAEEISILGYQSESGYYAFAQGIFDGRQYRPANDFGIVEMEDRSYYLPAFSVVNERAEMEYHNERKFIYQPSTSSFAGWSAQLLKVFGDNATVGICFTVAALFREIVYTHANCFPILFLFGPRGTGKTTFRLALKRLFGNYGPNDAIGLESASSPKGFSRKLAQVRNGLEAFEEYKNTIDRKLIGMLKNIYDGIGYERAQSTNDLKTHSTPVNSAVIVAGQEMPSKENALFSRVIMLSFARTNHSPEDKEAFNALEKMIALGLSDVLLEIIRHREQVRTQFQAAFAKIYGHLRQDPATQSLDERTLTNAAALLAPFYILSSYLSFPFDYKEAYQIFKGRILAQYELMNKTNEVNQFWQIFDYLAGKSEIVHNYDYKVEENGEKIFIHMPSIFPKYFELARKQNINALDQATLESYLCMQPYFERPQGGEKRRQTHRKRMENGQQKRCFAFFVNFLELEFLENGGLSGHTED